MDEMDEIAVRATKTQIEDFKESMLWLDIKEELERLARRAQVEYDLVGEVRTNEEGYAVVPTTSETLIHLGDIKGRRKAVNYFLSILDIFLGILEDISVEKESDEPNGG